MLIFSPPFDIIKTERRNRLITKRQVFDMKKLKFGILGCGMVANVHARAIKEIGDSELVAVCDSDRERVRVFAEQYGAHPYFDYGEMLASDIDVVCVCTPSCFHARNAIDALEAGKHVVLEKPMAFTSAEADKVIASSDKSGKKITVISQLRFSDDVKKVKKLIQGGAFGKITLCNLFMKYYRSREYYSQSSWKGKLAFDGGGALMNQGIHGIDLLIYIMGDIKSISGKIGTLSHDVETEDTAVATVEFECGALGVIEASTCAYPGFDRRIEIHGDNGYAIIRENKIEKLMVGGKDVEVINDGGVSTAGDPSDLSIEMHKVQIENLIGAIGGKNELFIDAREGKKAVAVIEKIYESAK